MRLVVPFAAAVLALGALAGGALAQDKAGELHRVITDPSAAQRDAHHDPHARVTVWYPAAADAREQPVVIGPPQAPVFEGGSAAPDGAWRPGRWPVILISHGFGGSARQMAWLGTELARRGYVVASVDHPGNNGMDEMTLAGATLWWLRAEDLRVALAALESDPAVAPHIDVKRLGVAGFSLGGFTSLVLAGAQPDPRLYLKHCRDHPDDGVCQPQKELPKLDPRQRAAAAADQPRDNPAPRTRGLPVKAVFLLAPAVISGLEPASLRRIQAPVDIVLGAADTVATPSYNGLALARLLPRATVTVLPGANHYDFLDLCTPAGQAGVRGYCRPPGDGAQPGYHAVALARALKLFDATLR